MGSAARNGGGDIEHIESPHTSGDEGLMGISESGVGDEKAFLFGYPFSEAFGPLFQEDMS